MHGGLGSGRRRRGYGGLGHRCSGSRRGVTGVRRDDDLIGVDDETAHRDDVVGRARALQHDVAVAAAAHVAQHGAQVLEFGDDELAIFIRDVDELDVQPAVDGAHGRSHRCLGHHRFGFGRRRRGRRGSHGSGRSRGGRGVFGGQAVELGHHVFERGRIDGVLLPVGVKLAFQHVFRFQEGIDHVLAQVQGAGARAVQNRLQHMREFGHVRETEGGRTALDGMRAAEDGVQIIRRRIREIEIEQ
ncbi:hypothetical protein LMG18090_04183 [Ralstonia mannitolilytica]|nr:hypothetical protein LMG18090_04183 [Ralstonia mannitolilytica]CAJ0875906.1 hypothetical protein R76727_02873 [Ralstonia mannitolilytica]